MGAAATCPATAAVATGGAREARGAARGEAANRVTTEAAHGATRGAAATSRVTTGAAGAAATCRATDAVATRWAAASSTTGAAKATGVAAGAWWTQKYVAVHRP